MALGDSNYGAEQTAEELRADLLSEPKIVRMRTRVDEIKDALCGIEIIGSPSEQSTAIAQFHLLKGKLDAFTEMLEDHYNASDILAQAAQQQQLV